MVSYVSPSKQIEFFQSFHHRKQFVVEIFGIVTVAIFYFPALQDAKAIGPLVAIGTLTSLWGCVTYYFSFLIAIKDGSLEQINFTTKNWHIIEAFAFLVFLIYGPPTIWETFNLSNL